ncbi:MAG: hypothetical protein H6652_06985 [Ardenticatenaceae bacterium]|nr:hypothetical protein [Ardenticatenaceae bacterium]
MSEILKCTCGSERCARILYGRIAHTAQLQKDLASGKVVLGGCIIFAGMPDWRCLDCGREWAEEADASEQQQKES